MCSIHTGIEIPHTFTINPVVVILSVGNFPLFSIAQNYKVRPKPFVTPRLETRYWLFQQTQPKTMSPKKAKGQRIQRIQSQQRQAMKAKARNQTAGQKAADLGIIVRTVQNRPAKVPEKANIV